MCVLDNTLHWTLLFACPKCEYNRPRCTDDHRAFYWQILLSIVYYRHSTLLFLTRVICNLDCKLTIQQIYYMSVIEEIIL